MVFSTPLLSPFGRCGLGGAGGFRGTSGRFLSGATVGDHAGGGSRNGNGRIEGDLRYLRAGATVGDQAGGEGILCRTEGGRRNGDFGGSLGHLQTPHRILLGRLWQRSKFAETR